MAKYKIVSRRKKVSPLASAPVQEPMNPSSPETSAVPENGEAAFRLYEEFFKGEPFETPVSPAEAQPLPETKEDLIAPESMEPTVEFTLDEVRRAFDATEETGADEDEDDDVKIADEADMGAFFKALFGESEAAVKEPEISAAPAAAALAGAAALGDAAIGASADATRAIPVIPTGDEDVKVVSSDTIRIPKEAEEPSRLEEETGAEKTRASITDLINETAAKQKKREESETEEDSFSSEEDTEALRVEYKKKNASLWRRVIALLVLFFGTLYLESATFSGILPLPLPEFLKPGRFGSVYLLIELQLLVFAAAFAFRQVKNGFVALFTGRGDSDSVACLALLSSAVHTLILLLFFPTKEGYVLFGSISVFLALCSVLRALFEHGANTLALQTLATGDVKYAAAKTGEGSPELEAFSDYVGEIVPEVYSVSRGKFIDGFLRRVDTQKKNTAFTIALPLTLLVSVGIGVWCYLGGGEQASLYALSAFSCSMMMGLPAAGIFSASLPFFFASRQAAKTSTALLGEAAVNEACEAEIVSFDDNEVFLPKYVKVTSVRTYGNARIDRVLIHCAQIFRIVGGPLSFVFENSISSLSVPGVVEILENNGDGICARIDGKEIYLGGAAYMESYEFPIELDENDTTYENTVGRIMYFAEDGELAAKFYIKYAVSARFCAQLSALNRAGIYAVIKTCDPNVDAALLQKILGNPSHPIAVIKTGDAAQNAKITEHLDAPIAGSGKISAVLNGFLLCEGVRGRAGFGTLVNFVSTLLGLFITFFLGSMRNQFLSPVVCLLYQGIWLLPVVIPALFDWPLPPRRAKKNR